MSKYYFTKQAIATEQEVAEATKVEAKLVNGLYGDTFKKRCITEVYGNYPKHLAKLAVKATKAKTKTTKKSPEIKSKKKQDEDSFDLNDLD